MSDQLTLFAADTHASRSQQPGSDWAMRMTATSGQSLLALSKNSGQLGSLERTLLVTSAWASTMCFLTWRPSATPAARLLFRLVPSMPRTGATGFGLLPTPAACEEQLASRAKVAAETFVTSSGTVRARRPDGRSSNLGLSGWALLPTPTTSMHKGSSPATLTRKSGRSRVRDRLDHTMQAAVGSSSLNPRFVEQMMGFPLDWTLPD